jgi:hypothetical protein
MPDKEVVKYYFNKSQMVHIPNVAMNMWDRSGVLTPNTDIVTITKIGSVKPTELFDNICIKRAEELYNKAKEENKKLFVFWSGGLDSTATLLSLIMVVTNKDDLVVLYTENSIKEYPSFLGAFIDGKYKHIKFTEVFYYETVTKYCMEGIVVTGEIGDQLFGSALFKQESKEDLQRSWKTYKNISKLSNIEAFVEACPQPINTVAEFLWWLNYSMKYQCVQTRMLLDNTVSILNKNIFHFFDTEEFNDYTVSTEMQVKLPEYDIKKYKYPLRKFIDVLSKDSDYAYNKEKIGSYVPVYGKLARLRIATTIDTNWVRDYK